MVEHQGPRRHAVCQILVDGQDISNRLYPYLISVQATSTLEGGMSECHIELDDRNAELRIPPDHANLTVSLGWAGEGPRLFDVGRAGTAWETVMQLTTEALKVEAAFGGPGVRVVFDGYVSNVESGFGRRGGGRRMWIEGKGHDDKGQSKETQRGSMGEGKKEDGQDGEKIPLKDVMSKVFGFAGISVALSPEMEKISRDYWHYNDSAMNFGKRIAQETGGFFTINKNKAVIVSKDETVNVDGEEMPQVDAIWGINLIGWRIKPYIGRPQYGSASARYFDIAKGLWQSVEASISAETPFGGTSAVAHGANAVADKTTGEHENKGSDGDVSNRRGTGWVLLNGEPTAQAGGTVRIEGARPGVDGTYKISEAEHNYTRGVGYTTRCQVMKPDLSVADFDWKQGAADAGQSTGGSPDDLTPAFNALQLQREADARAINEQQPKAGEPGAPVPPLSGEQTYTAEELEAIRRFNESRNVQAPISQPNLQTTDPNAPGFVPVPPISGEQTFTAQELEQIRQDEIAKRQPQVPISQ